MSEMKNVGTLESTAYPNVNIAVRNFGPIAEGTVNLRPLTVFAGPSHTGKTYLSLLLYALHRSFAGFPRYPFPQRVPGDISASALNVPVASAGQGADSAAGFRDGIKNADFQLPLLGDLPKHMRDKVQATLKNPETFTEELKRCFDVDALSQLRRSVNGTCGDMEIALEVHSETGRLLWHFKFEVSESGITVDGSVRDAQKVAASHREDVCAFMENVNGIARKPMYLPADRSGILQHHALIAKSFGTWKTEDLSEVPRFSMGVADFLQRLNRYRIPDKKRDSEMLAIADALEDKVLAGQIIVKPSSSGYPQFLFRPRGMKAEIRLTQVSSMVSELAPLVLFIRGVINPGDMLFIEEPGAHLHPGVQPEIAVALARLVKTGVRVVVTTHSGEFLEEIGNLIREGELENLGSSRCESMTPLQKEQVGVWYFQTDRMVREIAYNLIEGVAPVEFLDAEDELYNRSARLQNWIVQTEARQRHECA